MKTSQSLAVRPLRLGLGLGCLLLACFGCASDRVVWSSPDEVETGELARVIIPNEIELLSVDGQAVHGISFLRFRERRDLLLNPGPHRLVVRLRPAYDLADEDHRVLVTESRVIDFEAAPEGRYRIAYRLSGPGGSRDPAAAPPAIWLEDVSEGQ